MPRQRSLQADSTSSTSSRPPAAQTTTILSHSADTGGVREHCRVHGCIPEDRDIQKDSRLSRGNSGTRGLCTDITECGYAPNLDVTGNLESTATLQALI